MMTDTLYQTLKDYSLPSLEWAESKNELFMVVEEQLRDLECHREEYRELTDSEWEDLHYCVWEDLCETFDLKNDD